MVAFPEASGSHRNWNAVVSVSLASHHRVEVARSAFEHGLINWVGVSGTWIVYVDQSARQSDSAPNVLWRVVAVEPGTKSHITLSSNGQHSDPFVPVLQSQGGFVFWTQAEKNRSAREFLWKAGWAAPRDVFRHGKMSPGSASIDAEHLVYVGPATTGASKHPTGGDCWRVPLHGGAPQPVTHTGRVMGCFANNGWLAWTLHIDPESQNPPPDGILDDPYELWAKPSDGAARLLERGYIPLTNPAVGAGYVIWQTYPGALVLQSIDDPTRRTTLPGKPATDPQVTDDAIVYVTTNHGVATAHALPLTSIGR
jgi:hypothetical protein